MARKINVGNGAIVATANSTTKYIQDIKKNKALTKQHEAEMLSSGDPKQINQVIEANLKFVSQVALKYQGMGLRMTLPKKGFTTFTKPHLLMSRI